MKSQEFELPPLSSEISKLIEAEKHAPGPAKAVTNKMFANIASSLGIPITGTDGPSGSGSDPSGSPSGDSGAGSLPPTISGTGGVVESVSSFQGGLSSLLTAVIKPATIIAFAIGAGTGIGTHAVFHKDPKPQVIKVQVEKENKFFAKPIITKELQNKTNALPKTASAYIDLKTTKQPRKTQKTLVDPKEPTTLSEERNLIEMARTALARGQAQDAYQALKTHQVKYPKGKFVEERQALIILSLVHLGKIDEANDLAKSFRKKFPNSLLLPTINSALKKEQ